MNSMVANNQAYMIKTGLFREQPELNLESNNFLNSSYFSFREEKNYLYTDVTQT